MLSAASRSCSRSPWSVISTARRAIGCVGWSGHWLPRPRCIDFFAEIIEHSIQDRQRKGCFLVNSALEIAPHDAECRAVITEQFNEIEAFFRRCILKAQADETVSSDVDPGDTARLLLGVLLGVRVLARTKPERAVLEGVVRPALAMLEPPRKGKAKQ